MYFICKVSKISTLIYMFSKKIIFGISYQFSVVSECRGVWTYALSERVNECRGKF